MFDAIVITEDPSLSFSEPETIFPCQFFERARSPSSQQPEKRLMLGVLEDAIATFQNCSLGETRRKHHLLEEVEEWFASADVKRLFSFQNICATLGLDANYLLWGLAQWKTRQPPQQQAGLTSRPSFRRVNGRRHSLSAYRSPQPKRKAA